MLLAPLITIASADRVDDLLIDLKDNDSTVRWQAAQDLGETGDARAVEPLIEALKDENGAVRLEATCSLGTIGDARAVEPLIEVLDNGSSDARDCAAYGLEKIGNASVESLILALKDKGFNVRYSASEILGDIGDVRAIEELSNVALNDENSDVRAAAKEALEKLKQKG